MLSIIFAQQGCDGWDKGCHAPQQICDGTFEYSNASLGCHELVALPRLLLDTRLRTCHKAIVVEDGASTAEKWIPFVAIFCCTIQQPRSSKTKISLDSFAGSREN